MAAYRKKSGSLGAAERDKAFEISHIVAANPTMKKAFWFMEADLQRGNVAKMDNTGKSLLQLLRHLKRFTEVRP
jgi:Spindle and kinetochore-associated protein 1